MQLRQSCGKLVVTVGIRLYTGYLDNLSVDVVELLYGVFYKTYDFGELT